MNPIVTELMKVLPRFEGSLPYMYLDSVGKVTAGIGHLLPNAEVALSIPWNWDGTNATPVAVRSDYALVQGSAKGHTASFYAGLTICRLREGWAEEDAANRLETEFLPSLPGIFEGFDGYPLAAQVALLDMVYNMGEGRDAVKNADGVVVKKATGLRAFGDLRIACESANWQEVSKECHRAAPVNADRNNWTRDQFLSIGA